MLNKLSERHGHVTQLRGMASISRMRGAKAVHGCHCPVDMATCMREGLFLSDGFLIVRVNLLSRPSVDSSQLGK